MKLWKIMLAALICVLMMSVVAMADDHVCTFSDIEGSEKVISYTIDSVNKEHTALIEIKQICSKCFAVDYRYTTGTKTGCNIKWGTPTTATCTAKSYKTGACTVCGASYTEKVADETAHDWRAGQVFAATCLKGSHYIETCMVCGKTAETVHNDRVACSYVDTKLSDATCKAKAKYAKVCKWCKEVLEGSTEERGEKAAHDYAWTTTIEATCTTDGVKTGVCKVCGDKNGYDVVKAAGHKANFSTQQTQWPTCTAWGKVTVDCYVCGVNYKLEDKAPINHVGKTVTVEYKDAACGYDGNFTYTKCTSCGMMWDVYGQVITAVPVIPANGKHILQYDAKSVIKDCTATNNYVNGNCVVCGQYARVYVAAKAHSFKAAKNENLIGGTKATCTTAGSGYVECTGCSEQQWVTVPALGHKFDTWTYGNAATCVSDLIATSICSRSGCHAKTEKVIEEALGHNWVLEAGTDATCTTAGIGTRVCTRCFNKQNNVTIPAKGHNFTKTVETVKPTCDAQGYTVFGCAACDATQKGNYTAALGHNYSWVVVTKPSEAGNGKNEYTCALCKKVADTKTIKYTKMYYNNTMTSFGPTTKELVGGNDWYRVTPVDLTVDGVYTYDLIASNKYIVGKVTIAVNAGTLTVSYKANGVDVKDEALLIYASKADLANGTAVTAPVGAAINAAETFGADTKVLVSLVLTGDYDAAGKGLVDASAAAGMIANID